MVQLHLQVRDITLLQWTGDGASGFTEQGSAGAGAGCAANGWDARSGRRRREKVERSRRGSCNLAPYYISLEPCGLLLFLEAPAVSSTSEEAISKVFY